MKIWKKGAPSCCWKRMNWSNLSAFDQFSHSVMPDPLWPIDCNMPGLPVCHQLPDLALTHVHWVGDAIQPSHPLLSPFPPTFNLSQHQGLFQWVIPHIRGPEYWSFSFSISPSNEHSRLISFRMDWLDILAVPGTLKSLLQNHSSKASILWHSTLWFNSHIHTWLLEKP